MEIVSDSELQRMCANRLEYDRAEELYYDDRVYSMTMTKVSGASVEFKADIEEYDDTELTASVEIEQTGSGFRIRDYACSCRESRNLLKMCRHAAAVVKEIDFYVDVDEIVEVLSQPIGAAREVLEPYEVEENDSYEKDPVKHLQYLQQMVDKQMKSTFGDSSYGITTGSGKTFGALPASEEKRTTPVLQKVMNELLEEERDQFGIVVEGQQDIRLELTLHLGQNEPEIALRIGRRQLYVVRNIREFVYAVRERSFVRYGKNLEFIHMKHAFRPDAWKLLDFLLDYPFDTQSLNYYGYYTQESKRRLELESKQLDELIPVMEQLDDVYVSEYNDGERKPLYVRHEDPVLPVKIISTDNGNAAQLIFPERVFVLQGVWQLYVYWDGSLYVCTDDYAHKMKKILSLMSGHGSYELNSFRSMSGRTDVLEVRRQDYSMFCATMLPVMKKYMNVSLEHVEFERYLPEPASFEVYLDIDPDNSVVCRAWVSYGDRKHNIWNPASYKDVYRDMRAEYELRSLLGQYFPNISEDSENCYLTEDDDRLAVLVEEGVGQIEQLADVYVSDDFKKIRIAQRVQIVTGVSVKGNLLQVSWNVDNMTAEELEQVLQSYRHKRKYHRLKSGELLSLQQSGLEFLADMQEDLQLGSTQIKKGMAEVPMYRALYLEKLMKDNTDRLRIIRSRRFEEKILDGNEAEEQKALDGLLRMVQPFILRRLKQDVLEELPDKLEKVVYARFDREQEKLYRAVEKNIVMSLRKDSEQQYRQNKLQILAELTKLRQICCDPSLLYENYSRGSAKLAVCLEYIRNAIAGGHRILLFSQFTTMLDIIEQNLEKENIRSLKLIGATSKLKRRELVDRFQQNHAEVFLISLKAGGTGLNLTAADIVIHYDPWWNVAAQNQATDRAHRIGQENKVTVIRLIAADTIEERIVKLQEKKKELADKVITGEGMSMASLGRDELLELFEVDNS